MGRPVHVSGHSWGPTQPKEARTWARRAKGPCLVQARAGPASGGSAAHASHPWGSAGHAGGTCVGHTPPALHLHSLARQVSGKTSLPVAEPRPSSRSQRRPERAANPHFTQELSCQATRGSILWDLFITEHFKLANICTGLCRVCCALAYMLKAACAGHRRSYFLPVNPLRVLLRAAFMELGKALAGVTGRGSPGSLWEGIQGVPWFRGGYSI